MRKADRRFWRGYRLMESGLDLTEDLFVSDKSGQMRVTDGALQCVGVVSEAAGELCIRLNLNDKGGFEDNLWSLGRSGLLKPLLLADLIDVYRIVVDANSRKIDPVLLYAQLVRVMEVLEAGWETLQKALGSLDQA